VSDTILELQNLLGNYFASVAGGGEYAALLGLLFFAVICYFLHLPLEVCLVIAIPLVMIMVAGAGLPAWVSVIVVLAAGAVIAFALLRVAHR